MGCLAIAFYDHHEPATWDATPGWHGTCAHDVSTAMRVSRISRSLNCNVASSACWQGQRASDVSTAMRVGSTLPSFRCSFAWHGCTQSASMNDAAICAALGVIDGCALGEGFYLRKLATAIVPPAYAVASANGFSAPLCFPKALRYNNVAFNVTPCFFARARRTRHGAHQVPRFPMRGCSHNHTL